MMIVMMLVVVDLGGMRVGKRQELVFDSEFLTNNDGGGDTGQNLVRTHLGMCLAHT